MGLIISEYTDKSALHTTLEFILKLFKHATVWTVICH